jgi:hypothetical protein
VELGAPEPIVSALLKLERRTRFRLDEAERDRIQGDRGVVGVHVFERAA